MELRKHPFLFCDGVRMWPPKWLFTTGPAGSTSRTVTGEVGVLDAAYLSRVVPPVKVYLVIVTDDGNSYLGNLMFEKSNIAEVMYDFLLTQINRRVSEIGSIDIPVMNEKLC
jgi:hypothetical protein